MHSMPPAPSSSSDFLRGSDTTPLSASTGRVALDLAKILLGDQERGGRCQLVARFSRGDRHCSWWITGNPHLTRRWPFGGVTEGLPTIHPERRKFPYCDSMSDSPCDRHSRTHDGTPEHRRLIEIYSTRKPPHAMTSLRSSAQREWPCFYSQDFCF